MSQHIIAAFTLDPKSHLALQRLTYKFVIVTEGERERQEVVNWCIENFGPDDDSDDNETVFDSINRTRRWFFNYRSFFFIRDSDAILFKLRWS